jgi:putative ABC transport system substrate-binding protein
MRSLRRREFITLLGAAATWSRPAHAQQATKKIPKVGVLWHAENAEGEEPYFTALRDGFSDVGYVEGRNIALEHRFPNERPDRFRAMAAELAALPVDVLVGVGAAASPYVKGGNQHDPDCLRHRSRSRREQIGRESCPPRRKRHRDEHHRT